VSTIGFLEERRCRDLKCCKWLKEKSEGWLRGPDLNRRPLGYEPNELPGCSTPRPDTNRREKRESRNARGELHS
jgi:hypothetical protein